MPRLADEVLEAVLVGIGARQPRGDLGAIDRSRHHTQAVLERAEIEASEMKDLENARVGQKLHEVGSIARTGGKLHHVGGAITRRELHDAQPVTMGDQGPWSQCRPRPRHLIAREVRKITAMQANGHSESKNLALRDILAKGGKFTSGSDPSAGHVWSWLTLVQAPSFWYRERDLVS